MAHHLNEQMGRSSTAMPWRCVFESPSRKGGDLDLRLCDPSQPPEGASPAVHAAEVVVSGTQRANYRLTKLGHRQHEHDRGPALNPRPNRPSYIGRTSTDSTRAILATSPRHDKRGSRKPLGLCYLFAPQMPDCTDWENGLASATSIPAPDIPLSPLRPLGRDEKERKEYH